MLVIEPGEGDDGRAPWRLAVRAGSSKEWTLDRTECLKADKGVCHYLRP